MSRSILESLIQLQTLDKHLAEIQAKGQVEKPTSLSEIEAKKTEICKTIPLQYLSLYQRLLSQRGGTAIVELRGNSCNGCNMLLTLQFVNELKKSQKINQCQNCKRILAVFPSTS